MTDARVRGTAVSRPRRASSSWHPARRGAAMCAAAAFAACTAGQRGAVNGPGAGQQILRAGTRGSTVAPIDHFTGRARVDPLFSVDADIKAAGAYVTFEPGARSAWHAHVAGQRLVVTSGTGLTQEWGQPVQEIRPGDVVWCPPGVKHWHGAAPTTAMTHLAVTGAAEGESVIWMEKVTDAQYNSASAAAPRDHETMTAEQTLSARQRAIPPIAAFMTTSDLPKLDAALNQGLDAGLTISEIKEILVQLYAYVGFPRSLNALGELMKVVGARKQRGIHDVPGREPSRAIPTGDALVAIGTANQTRLSGTLVQGPLFDFAPIINQYLRAHLFGDIFERDNLDWQSRELATVGALAASPGVEPQLRSHMAASLRVGLTAGQLRQLTEVLADRGEAEAAQRATEALTQTLAATQFTK